MEYNFKEIEAKWRQEWEKKKAYKTSDPGTPGADKPKYYVLDMFPYPSGAGLHVGHPLGYIASDIFARFKRLKGFNVLHPMGYDAFGLPAEQYAIETGQHPAVTTMKNIARYREQLDKIGFSFDWSREVRTSDPKFYKWTQWIFLKLFNSWYNPETGKAEAIDVLIAAFGQKGYKGNPASSSSDRDSLPAFTGEEWKNFDEKTKSDILMNFRLAYLSEAWVNWCPKLGTVLANDEVKDGVSERGGYPVERKLMPQWSLRITAYADRLLNDLDTLDWPENIKEAQRNWIGRSEGAKLEFNIQHSTLKISVFTTRPDTIFGVSFLTLAPENELVMQITAPERKQQVEAYLNSVKSKSDRERQAEVKNVSGEFTGAYAIHPFTGKKIPVWVGDYVLSGYGTGAVMGVPAHDSRDHAFAKHFGLEIIPVIQAPTSPKGKINEGTFVASPIGGQGDSYDAKEGKCINSDFLNGLEVKDAIKRAIEEIESKGIGTRKINYRLRDAAFGRQRYWGEPIPIYYRPQGGAQIPTPLSESELPLVLPEIDNFKPTVTGEPPLARAKDWKYKELYNYEYTTMPGWAGSSWYYLRYMDPSNAQEFASQQAINYWQSVDLYVGGAEHVTGHLLYVRFWTKFLHDLGYVPFIEPTKKLVNQGMILGESAFAKVLQVSWTLPWPGPDSLSCPNITPNKIPLIFIPIEFTTQYPDPNVGEISKELDKFIIEKLKKYNPDQLSEINKFSQSNKISIKKEYHNKRVPVEFVNDKDEIDIERYTKYICSNGYQNLEFFPEGSKYKCFREPEKMSKSKGNVVNPDDIIEQYGADTLRLYEMFLGPIELSKPWSTQGISGVHSFLKKLWRTFFNSTSDIQHSTLSDEEPTPAELKILHKTIKKVNEDIERLNLNTSVSAFMICLNELTDLKCNKKAIYEPLLICLSPFAPFITEELWSRLGHSASIMNERFPVHNEAFLHESAFAYPISFNGKTRLMIELPLTLSKEQIEKEILQNEQVKKYIQDKPVKKVIVVPNKIVNIVI